MPVPAQVGHGRLVITWPRNERCTLWISPRPPQVSQVAGWVPGAVPAPAQVAQTTAVSTVRSRVDAERGLGQLEVEPDQRVGALPDPAARAARPPLRRRRTRP